MNKRVLFLLIFSLVPLLAKAELVSLTLDETIAIALRDNRDILLSKESVEKAKASIKEAQALALPALNFSASRLTTQELMPKPYSTTEIHAGLEQVIFASGRIINTIKYNQYQKEAQQALLDSAKLEVVLNVKKAFCTLILAKDLRELNKSILENALQHLYFIEERYKNGQASEAEILNIKASLGTIKQEYDSSSSQVEAAQALLRKLLYLDGSVDIAPIGEFVYQLVEIAYDKAILEAMAKRPEIKQFEAQAKAGKKAINIARAGNLPSVYATWDTYSGDRFITSTGGTAKWKNYNVYGIVLSWPLFDGFATQAKIEQAVIDLKETQLSKERMIKDIAFQVKESYLSLKDAISQIEAVEAEVVLYTDNLSTVKQKYQEGITSFLDVGDAQLKYALALFNKKQSVYDYIVAKASFDKATGGV
jgi:outer membrane protein